MRKIILCLVMCGIFVLPIYASVYDSFTNQQKTMIQNEINFYQKLKTCSNASFSDEKVFIKTNGIKNGMCNWEMNYGNSGMLNVECSGPISATSEFATKKIEYLKAMYGINTDSNLEAINKILADKYTYTYCK